MKTLNVTEAKHREDRTIELTISDPLSGAEVTKQRYLGIRGGVSWPTTRAPAYFCIVGQEFIRSDYVRDKDSIDQGKLILLAEYESNALTLENFYSKLNDLGDQFGCQDFYVTLPENRWNCGFLHDFIEFSRNRNGRLNLCSAYDQDNFLLGVTRIKQGIDSEQVVIPSDSIIYSQLQELTRQDLEGSPEERFHAINGMRHAIGSFHRSRPSYYPQNRYGNLQRPHSAMAA